MSHNCDICGTTTYLGRDASNRYCPSCETLRPIEKIETANGATA